MQLVQEFLRDIRSEDNNFDDINLETAEIFMAARKYKIERGIELFQKHMVNFLLLFAFFQIPFSTYI